VLESVRASLQPGVRRCVEDVDTCRMIIAKAQTSSELGVRRPGERDADGIDECAVDSELARLRKLAVLPGVETALVSLSAIEKVSDGGLVLKCTAAEAVLVDIHSSDDSQSQASSDEIEVTGAGADRNSDTDEPRSSDSEGSFTPPRSVTPPKNRGSADALPASLADALRKAE